MSEQVHSESLFDTKFTDDEPIIHRTPAYPDLDAILPDVPPSSALITFRVLVSSKEAGIIIGKNGNCVASVREKTGVKSGVSKVIIGCSDRILTVSGPINATAEALSMFAQALLESPLNSQNNGYNYFPLKPLCPSPGPGEVSLRLLIPHSQMGTLIGKQGNRIKALQETFNVKIVASKEFLQDSTERVVEVQGTPDNIEQVLRLIVRCLIEDWHGATGTIYYIPQPKRRLNNNNNNNTNSNSVFTQNYGLNLNSNNPYNNNHLMSSMASSNPSSSQNMSIQSVSQTVEFPNDFVGCLIGKKGSKIQEIRKSSNAQISISQEVNENGEREFTISGGQFNVDKALSLLYQQIQKEKARRANQD